MAIEDTTFDDDGAYEIRTDERNNVLYLSFSGSLSTRRMKAAVAEAQAAAETLGEEFAMINDISTFSPPSSAAAESITDAQQRLTEMDVGDVVRVTGEETSAVVANAFERRSRAVGSEGTTAATVRAAERKLGL